MGEKIWLNKKYIKTKQNQKLEKMFFGPFHVLHVVGKQAYKLKLPSKWKIHYIFHISLLEQNIIRKGQVNQNNAILEPENKFEAETSKKYEVTFIINGIIYRKRAENQFPHINYLVS